MSKKESSKKNVFGLVSKLGNLIKRRGYSSSNTENTDASSGENDVPKKNYNIHISEDDQGDDIDLGDEEEEEEEEEEEKEKEKEKVKEKEKEQDSKEDSNNNNKENINEDKNSEKNKIDNIDNNIKDVENNINKPQENIVVKKEKPKKDETKEENNKIDNISKEKDNNFENDNEKNTDEHNIQNEEKINAKPEKEEKKELNKKISDNNNEANTIKNDKEEKISPENNIKIKEISENIEKEDLEEDINEACHLSFKKGNDFNSRDIYCIPISKIKNQKKKSIFQKMNLFQKAKNDIINYLIFIEENLMYFSKDIMIDKKNDKIRRINKVYNIKNMLNYTSNKELNNNKYKLVFEIMNKKYISKTKEYFIAEEHYKEFNDELTKKLKIYGNQIIKNKIDI